MPQKVSFLFGSGISIPAGMPCVNQITDKVLSGIDVSRHSDGTYYFGPPLYAHAGVPDEWVPRIVTYLKRLSVEIERYYSFDPERADNINYEDLYYVAVQIYDSQLGEYDNPIVKPFIDKTMSGITPLFVWQVSGIKKKCDPKKFATEATNYIYDIVRCSLAGEPTYLDYLSCLKDACQDVEISSLDLFTLNHDMVIERYLQGCGIEYTDGFGPPVNGVRYWSPEVLEHSFPNVRLLKLHGSVNWFRFQSHGPIWRKAQVGIAVHGRYSDTKDPNGQSQRAVGGRPMLLAGTFNKMLQYTSDIYADLYCELRRALRETQLLIVCGYGFGDKGINEQIGEWTDLSDRNAMVIIHAEPENLKKKARPDITLNWDRLLQSNRLLLVQKWIQHTSWKDIKDAIQI
jgi:SIR2-like domain